MIYSPGVRYNVRDIESREDSSAKLGETNLCFSRWMPRYSRTHRDSGGDDDDDSACYEHPSSCPTTTDETMHYSTPVPIHHIHSLSNAELSLALMPNQPIRRLHARCSASWPPFLSTGHRAGRYTERDDTQRHDRHTRQAYSRDAFASALFFADTTSPLHAISCLDPMNHLIFHCIGHRSGWPEYTPSVVSL